MTAIHPNFAVPVQILGARNRLAANAPLADLERVAIALDQAGRAIVADVSQRHAPALRVAIDLPLYPAPPGGIRQCDAFGLHDTGIVLDPEVLDQKYPTIAIFHAPALDRRRATFHPISDIQRPVSVGSTQTAAIGWLAAVAP